MEFMDGGNISTILSYYPEASLNESEITLIIVEILRGLAHLHSHSIIHRDIKSDNILLNYAGGVKLADFGFSAENRTDKGERRTSVVGTAYWMAPVHIDGNRFCFCCF
jgi:serine/threonine protein kinase